VTQLENKLAEKSKLQERAERDLVAVLNQKQQAEMRAESLSEELAEMSELQERSERDREAALNQKQQTEMRAESLSEEIERLKVQVSSSRGINGIVDAGEYEQKLEETERSYKERLRQLEDDYQLAAHYVK
jgi:hypothetical protein